MRGHQRNEKRIPRLHLRAPQSLSPRRRRRPKPRNLPVCLAVKAAVPRVRNHHMSDYSTVPQLTHALHTLYPPGHCTLHPSLELWSPRGSMKQGLSISTDNAVSLSKRKVSCVRVPSPVKCILCGTSVRCKGDPSDMMTL